VTTVTVFYDYVHIHIYHLTPKLLVNSTEKSQKSAKRCLLETSP